MVVPRGKLNHKNNSERVKCLMLGPIKATDGHLFGHKISGTCQQKDHREKVIDQQKMNFIHCDITTALRQEDWCTMRTADQQMDNLYLFIYFLLTLLCYTHVYIRYKL